MNPSILKLRMRLIGFGLVWMAMWAIFGSLLGYRIQEEIIAGQDIWLRSTQRELLRSTHSHMNVMGMLSAVIGLALPLFDRILSKPWLTRITILLPLSIILFGIGLLGEALNPPLPGQPSYFAIVTGIGGSLFLLILFFLGVGALRHSRS